MDHHHFIPHTERTICPMKTANVNT